MHSRKLLFSLGYMPLTVSLRCSENADLPKFTGSMLHGIMGWTLAPYRKMYEFLYENRQLQQGKKDIVNPYIIKLPRTYSNYQVGDELSYQFILLGDGVRYANDVTLAVTERKIFGLGADRKKFELFSIQQGRTSIGNVWPNEIIMKGNMLRLYSNPSEELYTHCSIHLLSPLRIRRNGELLINIDFTTIVRNIISRMTELSNRYDGYLDVEEMEKLYELSAQIKTMSSGIFVTKIERYSSKRTTKMDMSGLQGTLVFEGGLGPFIPLLEAARYLHIGRNVTFGYGEIDVKFW